jgi:subtilisin family serine protease
MVRSFRVLLVVLTLSLGAAPPGRADDFVPGEVIIQVLPGLNVPLLARLLGLRVLEQSAFAPVYRLGIPLGGSVDQVVALLQSTPGVVAADPNLISGALQYYPPPSSSGQTTKPGQTQYQLISTFDGNKNASAYSGQTGVRQVNYGAVAQQFDGAGVTVAILDTGISLRHAALAAQVTAGWNLLRNSGDTDDVPRQIDSDGNGQLDQAAGHGTMLAGIVALFAPKASLMPVTVLDSDGHGTLWAATEGVRYGFKRGARVLNVSFGFSQNAGTLTEAINEASQAGAVVVTSAGNANSSAPQYPAGHPKALTVAALNADNTKASFSNYGAAIDVDAPGVDVVSTFWDGTYASWSGTSFSAPFVAAEVALLLQRSPQLTADYAKQAVLRGSRCVDAWNPNYVNQLGKNGAGLIDFDLALGGS